MTVPVQIPYNSYTYAGSPTFVFSFQLLLATDLQVSVAGVVQSSSNYSITGLGVQTGGSITYTGTLVVGQLVELQRVTVLARQQDYQSDGDFLAATVNADYDRIWMVLQELNRLQSQAIRVPEIGGTTVLPAAAARAGLLMAFDTLGAPTVSASAASAAIGFTAETQTASAAQTVFTLTTTSYTPGGSNIAVFIDGFYIPAADYVQTSGTVVTFSGVTFSGVEQVTFLCGRLVGLAASAANVSLQLPGTGTAIRTPTLKAGDSRSLNDYVGADPTNASDSSAALANYATDMQAAILPVETKNHAPIIIDVGVYQISAQTYAHNQAIIGRDIKGSVLVLKAGETNPMFTLTAENISGTGNDDTNRAGIRNLTLIGNDTSNGTVAGVAHAINCPDAPFALGTQYGPSIEIENVEIKGFTGSGIFLGVNRNWAQINKLVVRYCNKDAMTSYGYDHRVVDADFGQCVLGTGVNLQAGGAHEFLGCNIYGNLINTQITGFANGYVDFIGCAFDAALHDGALIASGAGPVTFIGGRFYSSGQALDNTYADIHTAGNVSVLGTLFLNGLTGKLPKLTIQTDLTNPKVLWLPAYLDTSGGAATPFRTALVDDFTALRTSGTSDAYSGPVGLNALSDYCGGVEIFKRTSINTQHRVPALFKSYVKASLPAAASHTGGMIFVSDDIGGSTPAFSDGTNWRRVADRNIVS